MRSLSSPRPFLILIVSLLSGCSGGLRPDDGVDGSRALKHVEKMVQWGPHPAGSEAQGRVGDYIEGQLQDLGLEVFSQQFETSTPNGKVSMRNIWGEKKGTQEDVILLASHYDSKYFAGFDFVGANDGGASSGILLELARASSSEKAGGYTLWFVFFDGEEAFRNWTSVDSLYGSRKFVRELRSRGALDNIKAMILLDLVGGKELSLKRDVNSDSWLVDLIWETASEMGHSDVFISNGRTNAVDDHIPFAEAGIPVVDVIDLSYRFWHQPEDTLDKLSVENMEIVGNVVLKSLPKVANRLRSAGN